MLICRRVRHNDRVERHVTIVSMASGYADICVSAPDLRTKTNKYSTDFSSGVKLHTARMHVKNAVTSSETASIQRATVAEIMVAEIMADKSGTRVPNKEVTA